MRGKKILCEVIYDGFEWFDKLVVYYNVRLCVGLNRARSRHIILQLAVYTRVGGDRWIQRRAEESAQLPGLSKTSAVYDGIEWSFSIICCRESNHSDRPLSKARSAIRSGVRGNSEGGKKHIQVSLASIRLFFPRRRRVFGIMCRGWSTFWIGRLGLGKHG